MYDIIVCPVCVEIFKNCIFVEIVYIFFKSICLFSGTKTNGGLCSKEALERLNYSELRPNQRLFIENNIARKDMLFCSPLGSGKSLIFRAAPIIFKGLSYNNNPCVAIVVSPLTSLMKTQVKSQDSSRISTVLLRFTPMSLRCYYESCRCITI